MPNDPDHTLKIIDFGSSCDWGSIEKRGLREATCDPMYAPPEQKLQLLNPDKFDVFSVGMIGIRYSVYLLYWHKSTNTDAEGAGSVLFPSLTRGGVSYDWPGGYFQQAHS